MKDCEESGQVPRFEVYLEPSLRRVRKNQEVLDQCAQLMRLPEAPAEEPLEIGVDRGMPDDQVEGTDDHRQRGPQLMVHVAEKLRFQPIMLEQPIVVEAQLAIVLEQAVVESGVLK